MKKILFVAACCSFLTMNAMAQTNTQTSKSHKKTHKKQTTTATQQPQTAKDSSDAQAAKMRSPESGMTENGAGKTAPHQVTTKEKANSLNDMDESRN